MRDSREIRYYTSIPKIFFVLIASAIFVVLGWQNHQTSGKSIIAWLAIGFFGLCAIVALVWLVFALILRPPLLLIDATGITSSQALAPWVKVFVPWSEIARIGIRNTPRARDSTAATFQVQVRDRDRYSSRRVQRFVDSYDPTLQGTVISVPFAFLFFWASRKQRVSVLQRIQQTFAPEIIQYGVEVDEQE